MTLGNAGQRFDILLHQMLQALVRILSAAIAVSFVFVGAAYLVGERPATTLAVQLSAICLFCLMGHLIARRYIQTGNTKVAARIFFYTTVGGCLATGMVSPHTAAFTGAFLVLMTLTVVPQTSYREVIWMALVCMAAIGITVSLASTTESLHVVSLAETLVRILTVIGSGMAGVVVFVIQYRNVRDAIYDVQAANASLNETDHMLRSEVEERKQIEGQLRQQNAYLASLHEVSKGLMQRMDKQHLLEDIIKRACALIGVEHTVVHLLSDDEQTLDVALSIGLFVELHAKAPKSARRGDGLVGRVWESGCMQTIDDYRGWSGRMPWASEDIRELTVVPMISAGKVVGTIGITFTDPYQKLGANKADIVTRFAQLAAIALDNAQLYEASRNNAQNLQRRVDERTSDLQRLLAITNSLSSTFDMDVLLGRLFDELMHLVPHDSGSFMVVQGNDLINIVFYKGPNSQQTSKGFSIPLSHHHRAAYCSRRPVFIHDTRTDEPLARGFRNLSMEVFGAPAEHIVSWLGLPMIVNDRVIGLLTLDSTKANAFSQQHATLAMAVAQQAGLAIETARMHSQSVQAAANAERSRLARDLHDSVSQAVFSMALGARTMEHLAVSDPSRVLEPLPHVVALAEAALTEMRALIFELRPESLQEEGLLAALRKNAAALEKRHGLVVRQEFCADEPNIDLGLKEAFYRIGLEAMHNAVKHARASHIDLTLHTCGSALCLTIEDNGIGFDTSNVPSGHFGLKTMSERVVQYNGSIEVDSTPGSGTRIRVSIPFKIAANITPPFAQSQLEPQLA